MGNIITPQQNCCSLTIVIKCASSSGTKQGGRNQNDREKRIEMVGLVLFLFLKKRGGGDLRMQIFSVRGTNLNRRETG